jgi:putative hydrolase of the HAD superfamily
MMTWRLAWALLGFHKVYGEKLGLPFDDLHSHWCRILDVYYAQFLTGAISLQESRRRRMVDLFAMAKIELRMAEADDAFAVYRAEYMKSWRLFDDVLPALESLQRYRMAVLTNGSFESQNEKLRNVGIADRFENLHASAELGVAKPAPEVFWKVCQKMGIKPNECLHVGDRLDVDARGAKAAGLLSVWLNRNTADQSRGTFEGETITTLAELHAITKSTSSKKV